MTKAELRQRILKVRKNLSPKEHNEWSKIIFDKIISLPEFQASQNLFIYVAYNNEAETKSLIEYALAVGKTVCVPRIKGAGHMIPIQIQNFLELKENRYGILEPPDETGVMDKTSVDTAIVPGVVFDKSLNRIGFGGSYYDTFLKNTKIKKIALAFDFQIEDNIPFSEHDIKMDMIVTPSQIIK